jgi:peptidoglycan/LPS O-acetylase OafA/YrhL
MKRIKELDGIRGIAIFLVLIWHYIPCLVSSKILEMPGGFLLEVFSLTWSGVDLFFVLSGFLIVGILLDTKGGESYFSTFYIRRALRILPLYLVVVILFIVLSGLISNDWLFLQAFPLWSYFTFTQNFFMHRYGFGPNWLAVTWSLAVEEQFYLVLPFLVLKLSKKQLVKLFVVLMLMSPLFRLIFNNLGAYVFSFARADSILAGSLLAVAYRTPAIKDVLEENYQYVLVLFFVFLFGAGVLTLDYPEIGDAFGHLWLSGLYCLFVMVCTLRTKTVINNFVSNNFFVWMGLRSYGIYLFHQPVSGLMHQFLNGRTSPGFSNMQEFVAVLFSFLTTFLLAEISFRYFETFFLSYAGKFHYGRRNTSSVEDPMPLK